MFTIIINKNLKDRSYLFDSGNLLILIDLTNLDTSKVNNFERMFSKIYKLKEIKELESLDLSNFDTSKVINM